MKVHRGPTIVLVDTNLKHIWKLLLREAAMGIEQQLVAMAGIRNQSKCATGAHLHTRDLDASERTADQQTFFAPFGLKGLAECKCQRYKGP
jgi:hypothetical protein